MSLAKYSELKFQKRRYHILCQGASKKGAVNVLVSMAGEGSILLDENGNAHIMGVPDGKAVNSVGAGDSMVAGFIAGYAEKADYDYALRLGTASGSATAFSEGLAEKELINRLMENIKSENKERDDYLCV